MAAQFPIVLQEIVNLAEPPLSLSEKSFRHYNLALESDQFVCVKEIAADGSNQMVIVDMHNNNSVSKQPTKKAEAALMHTRESIIVLRGKSEGQTGHLMQIFNLGTKERILEHTFKEDIVFWKWISPVLLGVVTTKSVWHCSIATTGQPPEKIFDRSGRLADLDVQVINYTVDGSVRWCLLAAISSKDKKTIDGSLQLYSVEKKQQQLLDGHAGCFGTLVTDETKPPIGVFSFAERKNGQFRLHVMDIYSPRGEGNPTPFKILTEFNFPPEASQDFPIFEHLSPKYGTIFLVSRGGFLILLDANTGATLFSHRVSSDTVFVSCPNNKNGGVLFANRKGRILTATVNEPVLVPYIRSSLTHLPNASAIAVGLAKNYGLPGADEMLVQSFNSAFARGDYRGAARVAASMKSGALRTLQTINQFKAAPQQPGQPSPILQYFSTLLESGSLNSLESMELVRPVVAQGRKDFIEKWLKEDKLECTEELGDLIRPLDSTLALKVYEKSDAPSKVLQCYVERGAFDKIVEFAKKTKLQTDYTTILRNMVGVNTEAAVKFAKELLDNTPALIDINQVVEVMIQSNRLQEVTSILLDYLKGNRPEQGHLQTKLFELNLIQSPQVAEAIFQMNLFTHYDRSRIGHLCEKAGLFQRALEHYTEIGDIKRVMSMQSAGQINADWLSTYFGNLQPDVALECLTDMLRANRQNLQTVVQVAIKFHETIGAVKLTEMFESFGSWEGVFYFVGSILASNENPDIHFKYIEAASKLNQLQEVERVCRESRHYDPVRVKEYLKQAKLPDPRPLIYVCDLHGFVAELAEYLYRNSLMKYIEVYVVKVNPQQAPTVVGVLVDLDCSEDFIKSLLQNVRGAAPVKPLVEEVEKRNRLRLLLPWLEARVAEGNQEPELHNALAKIYIDTNRDPETFLKGNVFYDSKVVGEYCEERDPHLAFTAYKRAWGSCDEQLVRLTNANGLFRLQARYLVERQSPELWALVLDPENEFRQAVVDQVVASALPESTNAEEVSATVRAFITAQLPNELIELLEKIVLHNSDFSHNKNLQNLLILTAIKADSSRVTDYVNRLDNYDGVEIAQVAASDEYKLYEEAVSIYKKFELHDKAMEVVVDKIKSLDRALELAARCDEPSVWSKLGAAQLAAGDIKAAIGSFLKAQDATQYREVIEAAGKAEAYADLVKFLSMARKSLTSKDSCVDSEMVYALAKSDRVAEMEDFVMGSNTANVQQIGDRLFDENNYNAAKALYATLPNFSKLTSCHLKLKDYAAAVESAKRANSPKTWKEVNIACVDAEDFRNAHTAGLAIVSHPDHLEDLILNYERSGHFEELITLLETGANSDKAHVALFTELGVVYAKYKPAKLSDFIRSTNISSGRLNIPKLVRACERHLLWKEAVYLHITYKEFDQAASTMIAHPSAWSKEEFQTLIQKVANSELYYRAVAFYLDEHPMDLNHLLIAIAPKVDHGRIIQQIRKSGHLPLVQPYLEHVQQQLQLDISAVNTALNEIYLEGESVEELRHSISNFPSFDQLDLAATLEHHRLAEIRRVACLLYRRNHRFQQAIALSKGDGHYSDAMETAADSGSSEIAEDLLRFFVAELKNKECFCACLFICYSLLRPDVVIELAWRHGFTDQIMPYMIQTFREYSKRLDAVEKRVGSKEADAEKEKSAPNDYVPEYIAPVGVGAPFLPGMGNLAIMGPAPISNPPFGFQPTLQSFK